MVLVQKWPFLQLLFLGNIGQENAIYDILERKEAFLGYKRRSSRSRKIHILHKRVIPCVWSKNAHFFIFFFRKYRPGKCLLRYFRTKKKPFQALEKRISKSRKIDIFPTHGFSPKMAIFPIFICWEIQARKMSFTIFQSGKTPFQTIKTRSSKRRKIDIFPKGLTHGFGPKIAISPTFFFRTHRPEKRLYDILKQKKSLSLV